MTDEEFIAALNLPAAFPPLDTPKDPHATDDTNETD